ncbi:MAG: asparagine synthase-related protein [Patescibacteria group bacterium]
MLLPQHWAETIKLPVVHNIDQNWSFPTLEQLLLFAMRTCGEFCLKQNQGKINVILSGDLNSSVVLAMTRSQFPNANIQTFTIGSSLLHPAIIKSPLVARLYGTEHYLSIVAEKEIIKAKKEVRDAFGGQPNSERTLAYLLFKLMAKHGARVVISDLGIDELLGGYREHREAKNEQEKKFVFENLWGVLPKKKLIPLEKEAAHWKIMVLFPYLQKQVVRIISRIPLSDRTTQGKTKKPLRLLAKKYGVPEDVFEAVEKGLLDPSSKK